VSVESLSRFVTLVVTNLIKLAGLFIGVRAGLMPTPSAVVLAFSAFMMAGAQLSETTILAMIERFFGTKEREK
jgi:hypothetical protein